MLSAFAFFKAKYAKRRIQYEERKNLKMSKTVIVNVWLHWKSISEFFSLWQFYLTDIRCQQFEWNVDDTDDKFIIDYQSLARNSNQNKSAFNWNLLQRYKKFRNEILFITKKY